MTDTTSSIRLPLIAAVAGFGILAAGGAYLYTQNGTQAGESHAIAASEADRAVAGAGMSDAERKATEAVVRAYILEHPEILTEAAQILQQRETVKRLTAAGDDLTKPFAGAFAGNPNGDVTVVEFTDYNCGFCRSSVADVQRLIDEDKGVRVVFREVPILAPSSQVAARWALAAAKQDKYQAFHLAMFKGEKPNDGAIRAAAAKAGMNLAQAEADANSAAVNNEVEANLAMMQQVGFGGTPTFIIGDQILEGALGYGALKAAVAKARKTR